MVFACRERGRQERGGWETDGKKRRKKEEESRGGCAALLLETDDRNTRKQSL
jgi:hypothetical protein